jgi:hypothetical protein
MDEKTNKAFEVANYMATISNQRRIANQEFKQGVIYYKNGGTFTVTPELIGFTKALIDLGHTENVPFVDANNLPVLIEDVSGFLEEITSQYFEAVNAFYQKYDTMRKQRKISDIVGL